MTVLFRIVMMFAGYVWACIAASLVLALGTLTPEWNYFFNAFGVQSAQAQSAAMWMMVAFGALIIFFVGYSAAAGVDIAREREVFAAAGIAGGLVYWLFAGRNAGVWSNRKARPGSP